jgi:hypothetical protein
MPLLLLSCAFLGAALSLSNGGRLHHVHCTTLYSSVGFADSSRSCCTYKQWKSIWTGVSYVLALVYGVRRKWQRNTTESTNGTEIENSTVPWPGEFFHCGALDINIQHFPPSSKSKNRDELVNWWYPRFPLSCSHTDSMCGKARGDRMDGHINGTHRIRLYMK